MIVFRYGVFNQVCDPCKVDDCDDCEGSDEIPCEDCCPAVRLPEQRQPVV